MPYNGTVDLIAGIRQKNGGTFALVDAPAVRIDDNTRLSDLVLGVNNQFNEINEQLSDINTELENINLELNKNEIDERLLHSNIKNTRQEVNFNSSGKITNVKHIDFTNKIVRTDTFSIDTNPLVETRILDTGDKLTISTNLTTLTSTITYTPTSG